MNNEFTFYRDAIGKWRFYWLGQLPILFICFLLVNYGDRIINVHMNSFLHSVLGLLIIVQFFGVFQLLGIRMRIVSFNKNGMVLQIDPLDVTRIIEIKWDEIEGAKIGYRDITEPANLLMYGGPVASYLEISTELLIVKMKFPLSSDFRNLISKVKSEYPRKSQIECDKSGNEIWISKKPAGGYYHLLNKLNEYLPEFSENNIIKLKQKPITRGIVISLDILLALIVLFLNYLSIIA